MLKTYHYKGLTADNLLITGTYQGASPADVGRFLHGQRIRLVQCTRWLPRIHAWCCPVRPLDIRGFCIYMAHILASGKPLYESLRAFQAERSDTLTVVIQALATRVFQGVSLSEALASHPSYFPPSLVALIYRGEKMGDLASAFQHAHDALHQSDALRQKLHAAIRYPLFLFALFIVILSVFSGVLLPQIQPFLHQLPGPPSFATRALFFTFHLLQQHGWFIVGSLFLTGSGLWMVAHSRYKIYGHAFLLHLPLIGPLWHMSILTQIARTHRLLLTGSVDVLHALTTSRAMQNNLYVRQQLETLIQNMSCGFSLTAAFRATHLFPPFFLQVLETGEQSNSLASCFSILENYYSHLLHTKLTRLTEGIYPCALSIIGLLMIWMVMGVFFPLYDSLTLLDSA